MRNFVVREAILPSLGATTKEGVIRELVQSLHVAGYFREAELEEIVRAVMRREQLGSTGIGRGIAIPHARHEGAERLVGTLGISSTGVEFESADREKAFVFVLLISPGDRPGEHLRALESVVRNMSDATFVQSLRRCTTAEELWQLISNHTPNWGTR